MRPKAPTLFFCLFVAVAVVAAASQNSTASSKTVEKKTSGHSNILANAKTTATLAQDLALLIDRGVSQQDAQVLAKVMQGLNLSSVEELLKVHAVNTVHAYDLTV